MSYKTLIQTIGDTPMVELTRYSPHARVKIVAKLEGANPGGSVKDRVALAMVLDAQKKGLLGTGRELLEPTSGNTGIGLAMLSAVFGYRFTAVLPEGVSIERRKLLQLYGAQLLLTDGAKGTNHAICVARELAEREKKYVMLDQFTNQANVMAHYYGTGLEIIRQAPYVTHFVAGMGTGGTLMGVGKRLRAYNPRIEIIGVEPRAGSAIQGLRHMLAYTPPIFNKEALNKALSLEDDEIAFDLARDLFKKEGLSVGISSGAALWGAISVAKQLNEGVVVTLFPDRGDRYASTRLCDQAPVFAVPQMSDNSACIG